MCYNAHMATIVSTYTNDEGHTINVYESGAEQNTVTGKLIKGATSGLITVENATIYNRKRKEKTSRLIREKLIQSHNSMMPNQVTSSAEVIAEGAAMLYEGIVLNTEAYPRDRMEAWEKIGKYADVLPADIRKVDNEADVNAVVSAVNAGTAHILAQVMADVMQVQRQAVDGQIVDGDEQG